jgi:hypothetical protein
VATFDKNRLDMAKAPLDVCYDFKVLPLRNVSGCATLYCDKLPDQFSIDNLKWLLDVKEIAFELLDGDDALAFRAALHELTKSLPPPLHPQADRTCPRCASTKVLPVVYGLPGKALLKAAEGGEVLLGGCSLSSPRADHGCTDCRYEWRII